MILIINRLVKIRFLYLRLLLSKLSCVNKSFFILHVPFIMHRLVFYLWRLRILYRIFIVERNLIWWVIVLFWNIIILINTKTFIIWINWTICALYDICSLIRLIETASIIAVLINSLIMVIYIWRACVHLLAAN